MAFGTSIKLSNIRENWLFDFVSRQSTHVYLAFSDVTESSNFYHGVILNKPSIRESINLAKSTAKTGNISITIPDFPYQGSPISEEFFGGTNNYINYEVKIHSIINDDSKTQIGSFRLSSLSTDRDKLNLQLTAHIPWDFISLPNTKSTAGLVYEPVSYGNFTKNTYSDFDAPVLITSLTAKTYRPIPLNGSLKNNLQFINGSQAEASNGRIAFYDKNFDLFLPVTDGDTA